MFWRYRSDPSKRRRKPRPPREVGVCGHPPSQRRLRRVSAQVRQRRPAPSPRGGRSRSKSHGTAGTRRPCRQGSPQRTQGLADVFVFEFRVLGPQLLAVGVAASASNTRRTVSRIPRIQGWPFIIAGSDVMRSKAVMARPKVWNMSQFYPLWAGLEGGAARSHKKTHPLRLTSGPAESTILDRPARA